MIDDSTLDYLSILSKIEIEQKEKELLKEELEQMLMHFSKVQQLTEAESKTENRPSLYNVLREDIPTEPMSQEQLLSNAPNKNEDSLVVPRTIG